MSHHNYTYVRMTSYCILITGESLPKQVSHRRDAKGWRRGAKHSGKTTTRCFKIYDMIYRSITFLLCPKGHEPHTVRINMNLCGFTWIYLD